MRILLADDQPKVRLALSLLLAEEVDLTVVGEAATTAELVAHIRDRCPDLVLLDWEFPGTPAEKLLPDLHTICPQLRVIILSGRSGIEHAALKAGADGFVSKTDPPEQLLIVMRGDKA